MAETKEQDQNDYPYIFKWGQYLDSDIEYIREQVALARKENAPNDAIFRSSDGSWRRIGALSDHVRLKLGVV